MAAWEAQLEDFHTNVTVRVGADVGKDIPEKDGSFEPVVKVDESSSEIIKSSIKLRVGRMALTRTKFEVAKFNGSGDFALWQTRVKDLLAQQGVLKGL